jgi:predicted MFS family arabinose efflux permease
LKFIIVLLSLAAFASAASMRVTDAMLPRLSAQFNVGLAQAASVITVFSVAYGVMQVAFGPLGDRFGKLRVISLAAIGASAATLLCLFAPTFESFLVGRTLAGALCGSIIPLAMAWIGDVVPYEQRQPVLARFLIGQIMGIGGGAAIGGYAAESADWRWPFAGLAAWLFVSAALLLRESRRDPAPRLATGSRFYQDLWSVARTPWARVVIGTVCIEGVVVFGALAFIPTHLHFARGFALSQAGLSMILFSAGGIAFALMARVAVRRLGEVGLAGAGAVLLSLGLAIVAWTPVPAIAPLACLTAGLGFYMFHNTLQTNATQMAPAHRGAGMALFASMFFLGQSAGVAIAGVVAESMTAIYVLATAAFGILPIGFTFAAMKRSAMEKAAAKS